MKLQIFSLSENEKMTLLTHQAYVLATVDEIASYLVINGDATEEWRQNFQDESRFNYYDVLPKGKRLNPPEIEIEMVVPTIHFEMVTKTFKKNPSNAETAVLSTLSSKLHERKYKLVQMAKSLQGDELNICNSHLQYTQSFIETCDLLKISSQIILAEIGCLHYAGMVKEGVEMSITQKSSIDYIKFKALWEEIKDVIKSHQVMSTDGTPIIPYSKIEVLKTRQHFNAICHQAKSYFSALNKEGLLQPIGEISALEYLENQLRDMQELFFAKNDVNYTHPNKA